MHEIKHEIFPAWAYDEALLWMQSRFAAVKNQPELIVLGCGSHDEPIITLGKKNHDEPLNRFLLPNVAIKRIDRGGGATAHEPGQIVLYPVINTKNHKLDIKAMVFLLEQIMINFLHDLGIHGQRTALGPGVYVAGKKIGFIGLRIQEHITSHGLALNLLNDARIFSHFTPCNMPDLLVSSAKHHVPLSKPITFYLSRFLDHAHGLLSDAVAH